MCCAARLILGSCVGGTMHNRAFHFPEMRGVTRSGLGRGCKARGSSSWIGECCDVL